MLAISNPANFISLPENLDNLENPTKSIKQTTKRTHSLKRTINNHISAVLSPKHAEETDSGLWSANEDSLDHQIKSENLLKEPKKSLKNKLSSSVKKIRASTENINNNYSRKTINKDADQRFDMPSLIELNESSRSELDAPSCSIIIQECENVNMEPKKLSDNVASNSNLSQNEFKTNIFEFLINNQKNLNTKSAITNLVNASVNSNSDGNLCFGSSNHTFLQTLLIDLIQPPLAVSSQFDLSSTASTDHIDIDLSMVYQNQGDNLLNNTQISSSKQMDINQTFNNSLNSNYLNANKKQINDQIMRTCMGYLDYINKKHTRERRIQTIRNKISGFILLTTVFLLIFGLAMLVLFSLTNVLAKTDMGKLSRSPITSEKEPEKKTKINSEFLQHEIDYFLINILARSNTTKFNKERYKKLKNILLECLLKLMMYDSLENNSSFLYFNYAIGDFT
ncbi:unnamed protein product [Brachionus calyciflorus]|uniref:Uncharacterized protein n=1 Tax=Brachionus calyciflorus TaxID=104777 RepID=A0A814B039_9BILA|nr:unnamed protein product [Brachionus calyciflorus]